METPLGSSVLMWRAYHTNPKFPHSSNVCTHSQPPCLLLSAQPTGNLNAALCKGVSSPSPASPVHLRGGHWQLTIPSPPSTRHYAPDSALIPSTTTVSQDCLMVFPDPVSVAKALCAVDPGQRVQLLHTWNLGLSLLHNPALVSPLHNDFHVLPTAPPHLPPSSISAPQALTTIYVTPWGSRPRLDVQVVNLSPHPSVCTVCPLFKSLLFHASYLFTSAH
jgi:hypothetical protein